MIKSKWQKKYEKLYSYMEYIRDDCEKRSAIFPEGSVERESRIAQKVILNDMLRIMKQEMRS